MKYFRFISTIEPLEEDIKKLHHYIIKDDPYYDDSDAPPVPIQPGMHETIGSQTWSINGKNNNDDFDLISEKVQINAGPNLSGVSTFSSSSRSLQNSSDLSNSKTIATAMVADSMLTQPSSSSSPTPLFTFPPLLFTFPTFATIAPMIPHPLPLEGLKSELLSPVTFFTKEMQTLMSGFNNKLLLSNKISLPLPLSMLPEQFKLINPPAESVRSKRSNDYYDNIEEYSDETKGMNASVDDAISDNDRQTTARQKQKKDRSGLLDCMKLLKE